ncbi:MAG: hypothetical protein ABI137_16070 [Antricoccus sp.]
MIIKVLRVRDAARGLKEDVRLVRLDGRPSRQSGVDRRRTLSSISDMEGHDGEVGLDALDERDLSAAGQQILNMRRGSSPKRMTGKRGGA